MLALTNADDQWTALPGSDDQAGIIAKQNHQAVGAAQLR